MTKRVKILLGVAVVAVVAFLALGVFSLFIVRVVRVPTGSMANTLIPGESVLCSLAVGDLQRGDIVMFKYPDDPKVQFLSRVIGLPGDRIQVRGMKVFINDQELPEARTLIEIGPEINTGKAKELSVETADGPYRVYYDKYRQQEELDGTQLHSLMKFGVVEEFQVPPSQYFVMGDCRDNSMDSRYLGTVPRENVVGKALMIVASKDSKRLYQKIR